VNLLLDRGANIHAVHGSARGLAGGLVHDGHAIDLAIWGGRRQGNNLDIARMLVSRGATYDLTVAAALGDLQRVRRILDDDPSRIRETRPCGRRPLSAAVEFWNDDIARLLLERGADPTWDEPAAPRGTALHSAAARGSLDMVRLLLEHGADPNEDIDSAASPMAFAATAEIRALLQSRGARLDDFDTSGIESEDEALGRLAAAPTNTYRIGAAFTMSAGRPELLARLHGAGLRMPTIHTACQGYLLNADALRTLLAHGMSPDQMNWQHQTLLHLASTANDSECAAILLDAGATITVRDDEYRSTPLGWAARVNSSAMIEFLLARGAPTNLPDDEPWATPLAWATRRGHSKVVDRLRAAGAKS
jgi:ankyrin repeat protein